jgi:hypothetical protein
MLAVCVGCSGSVHVDTRWDWSSATCCLQFYTASSSREKALVRTSIQNLRVSFLVSLWVALLESLKRKNQKGRGRRDGWQKMWGKFRRYGWQKSIKLLLYLKNLRPASKIFTTVDLWITSYFKIYLLSYDQESWKRTHWWERLWVQKADLLWQCVAVPHCSILPHPGSDTTNYCHCNIIRDISPHAMQLASRRSIVLNAGPETVFMQAAASSLRVWWTNTQETRTMSVLPRPVCSQLINYKWFLLEKTQL